MTIPRALAITLALLPAMAIAADSVQMKPGRWIEVATPTSIMVGGKAQPITPDQVKTKSLCLSAEEGADPHQYFAVAEQSALCTQPSGTVVGGKIALASTCKKDPAVAGSQARDLRINGTYGAEIYAATAVMKTAFGNAPVEFKLDVAGHFDGVCRGDEDPRTDPAQ